MPGKRNKYINKNHSADDRERHLHARQQTLSQKYFKGCTKTINVCSLFHQDPLSEYAHKLSHPTRILLPTVSSPQVMSQVITFLYSRREESFKQTHSKLLSLVEQFKEFRVGCGLGNTSSFLQTIFQTMEDIEMPSIFLDTQWLHCFHDLKSRVRQNVPDLHFQRGQEIHLIKIQVNKPSTSTS